MTRRPSHPEYIPDKNCMNCGNPIPWRPGIPERARAKYCSETCRRTAGRDDPAKPCEQCGLPIPWKEGASIRARTRFCGNACKHAYQRTHPTRQRMERITVPCAECGKPVSFLPSQRGSYREGRSDNIYCSRTCKGAGHSKVMTGRRPKNGIYKNAVTFRSMIRREFHNRCALCGWDLAPCDVCHIIDRRHGGEDTLDNVAMLCPNDHRLFDLGLIPAETVRAAREGVLKHPSPR